MADKDDKKVFGKYASLEEAEKGYKELESKLGQHGTQMETLQKQVQESQAALQQYAALAQQWKPVVDFYSANQDGIRQWWATRGQPSQQPGTIRQQAEDIAEQQPGYQFLSATEKKQMIGEITKAMQAEVVGPWQQQFQAAAEQYAKTAQEQLNRQHTALTNVLWQTLQQVVPADKMKWIQDWHAEAMKLADPSKVDPMALAQNLMGLRGENQTLKSQLEDYQKKLEERDKLAVPAAMGGAPPSLAAGLGEQEPPKTREERYARVMESTSKEVGPEAMREMFPALGR